MIKKEYLLNLKSCFLLMTGVLLVTGGATSNASTLVSDAENGQAFLPYSLLAKKDRQLLEDANSCQVRNYKLLEALREENLEPKLKDLKEQVKTIKELQQAGKENLESIYFTDQGFVNLEYYATSWGEVLPIKDRKVYNCLSYQVIDDRLYCDLGYQQNPFTKKVKVEKDYPLLVSLPLDKFQLALPEDLLWRQRLVDYMNNSNFQISFVRLDDLDSMRIKTGQVLLFINGFNLGQKLIASGYALVPKVPLYISLLYLPALKEAIFNQKGLWNPKLIHDYGCPSLELSSPALVEKIF